MYEEDGKWWRVASGLDSAQHSHFLGEGFQFKWVDGNFTSVVIVAWIEDKLKQGKNFGKAEKDECDLES